MNPLTVAWQFVSKIWASLKKIDETERERAMAAERQILEDIEAEKRLTGRPPR